MVDDPAAAPRTNLGSQIVLRTEGPFSRHSSTEWLVRLNFTLHLTHVLQIYLLLLLDFNRFKYLLNSFLFLDHQLVTVNVLLLMWLLDGDHNAHCVISWTLSAGCWSVWGDFQLPKQPCSPSRPLHMTPPTAALRPVCPCVEPAGRRANMCYLKESQVQTHSEGGGGGVRNRI